mgnify:CR=1 FL=1
MVQRQRVLNRSIGSTRPVRPLTLREDRRRNAPKLPPPPAEQKKKPTRGFEERQRSTLPKVAPFSPQHGVIMLALHLAGSSRSPLVSERLRPLRMAVEGTGPGVGDYVYFAAVLALIPLIVGSVGSSARLPNEPAPLPHDPLATLARHTRSSLSVRRSSSSRATTRPTTQR